MYDEILNALYDGVYLVDANRKIIYWNKGAEEITGFTKEDVIGKFCHDNLLNHIDEQGRMLCLNGCPLHQTISDQISRETFLFMQHKKGYRIPVKIRTIPVEVDGQHLVAEVFTENFKVKDTMKTLEINRPLTTIDTLTGLPNRAYLEQYLSHQMNLNRTLDIQFGVVLIDVDTFEEFNNIFGKKVSDDVLKILAKTMMVVFGEENVIGRWRQDEFIFIFNGISKDQLKSVSEEIRILSEGSALRGAIYKDVDVTVSVGATLYHHGENIDTLMERAYSCLKSSKRKGGNFVTIK